MNCKKGIYLETQGVRVPCGQCLPCRINRGRKWSARILMENITNYDSYQLEAWFITLTYNDQTVPVQADYVQTLQKKKTLRWISDQQKTAGYFRYYAVGEYGELSGRPHYHLALFPRAPKQVGDICTAWENRFGYTKADPLNPERARYLANYTTKKLTKADDSRLLPGMEPEFRTSSRHPPLGAEFAAGLARFWSQPKGKKLIEERGDIERCFRYQGKIYPIGDWVLTEARKMLGIPILHRDRLQHPRYEEFHELQEAIWEPDQAKALEARLNGKAIQKLYRSTSQKL